MVIAAQEFRAAASFVHRGPSELTAPDHQRVFEQPAALEVDQEGRDRPVDFPAFFGQVLDDVVARSGAVAIPAPIEELDVPHATLDQAAGQKAVIGKRRRTRASRRIPPGSMPAPGGYP